MLFLSSLLFLSLALQAKSATDNSTSTMAEFDFYDVGDFDGFRINCGTVDKKFLIITYGGEAFRMYAADAPDDCEAVEMAPAIFQIIIDDYNNTNCPVHNEDTGLKASLWTLDVVIQMGHVRKWDDPYKQIVCNYGLGGKETSQQNIDAEAGNLDIEPVWQNAGNATSSDIVQLYVYDTNDVRINEATLGEYIQLRAFLQSTHDEHTNSIRIFNCKAYSENMSYYFVLGGCGEGEVLAQDRGFRTRAEDTGNDKITRVSRSAYFTSFLLPGKNTLTFECHYVLCPPDQCDEYSCDDSTMRMSNMTGRSKRDLSNSFSKAVSAGNHLPKVTSHTFRLLPQEEQFIISSKDLIHAEDDIKRAYPRYDQPYVQVGESAPAVAEGLDLLTIGLIAGMSFLAVLLFITLTCTLALCRRGLLQPYYHPADTRGSPNRSFTALMNQKSAGSC